MSTIMPQGIPLAIGSFPYKTPDEAIKIIVKYFPEVPLWPQLPTASPQEQMYVQFYEGMPGIEYDEEKMKLIAWETNDDFFEAMAESLSHAMEDDLEYFAVSRDKARGLYYLIENKPILQGLPIRWIKGQVTGPVSFCLAVADQNMKPILYDESYREAVISALACKAQWQVEKLKSLHSDVIIFIDEPYLASIGSSMVAFSGEEAKETIARIVDAIKKKGALSGIHCCGNTDWSILFETGCDIISIDCYEYGDNFLLYSDNISDFLEKGGFIAWGIIPTSKAIDEENVDSLIEKLEKQWNYLGKRGIQRELILAQSFITPSCGLGNIDIEKAEKAMQMCSQVSERMGDLRI